MYIIKPLMVEKMDLKMCTTKMEKYEPKDVYNRNGKINK